jgi:sodium/hydrogen antiporter
MHNDLNATAAAVVSGCVIVWGLVSARFERWDITAPIAFLILGLGAANGPLALVHLNLHSSDIRSLAEITLALVLFADASRINLKALRSEVTLPIRLLGIGLPLTLGAGLAAAAGLFAGSGLWLAAALGAIVAPTDAALGASIVQDPRVPATIRRALNVESGLNDGIVTPFVNLFLVGAVASETVHHTGLGRAAIDLVGGAGLGIGIGLVGGVLLRGAGRAGWSNPSFRPLAVLGLAVFAYATALVAGVNAFVGAFTAGIAFGTIVADSDLLVFAEEAGSLMSLLVWFVFGAVMVVPGFEAAGWRDVVFAVLALTVVRMGPVALALVGTRFDRATVAFMGWFGPRGLASVVFGLIAVDSLAPGDARLVLAAVTTTVTFSVVAHGITASPLADRYARITTQLHPDRPEHNPATMPSSRRIARHPGTFRSRARSRHHH